MPDSNDDRESTVLAIDLGKTACRARVVGDGIVHESSVHGAPGLAAWEGPARARDAIRAALDGLPAGLRRSAVAIGIGAAGVEAARGAARTLAEDIASELSLPVVIITDALAAHAGALGGEPGSILIVGTGSGAFGLTRTGELRRADGWGPWLGDEGSGRWIGQEGLKRALRGHDGRGKPTLLTDAAARLGDPDALPSIVTRDGAPERVIGAFAPAVLACAEQDDEVARQVVEESIRLLTATATSATDPGTPLAVVGGLTDNSFFASRLREALRSAGLIVVDATADALAGAALLAHRTDLPHERHAIRV